MIQKLFFILLLAGAILTTHREVQNADFVWKDWDQIVRNSNIQSENPKALLSIWTSTHDGFFSPISRSYYWIVNRLASKSSHYKAQPNILFHKISIGIHLINASILFLILFLLSRHGIGAFMGSLLFALHPLQIETIAWISATPILLGTTFAFLALYQYLSFSHSLFDDINSRTNPIHKFYISTFFFIFALLSHPLFIMVPFLALIIEKLLPRESSLFVPQKPKWPLLIWAALAIPFFVFASSLQETTSLSSSIAWWQRPILAGDAIAFYLFKLALPIQITPDFGRSTAFLFSNWWVYLTWLTPLALFGILLFLRSNHRHWIISSLLIFSLCLFPFLGFSLFKDQGTSIVASRYIYFAMMASGILLTFIIKEVKSRLVGVGVLIAVAILGMMSYELSFYWANDKTLWEYTLKTNEVSPIAHQILGDNYAREKNWTKAKDHYQIALKYYSTSEDLKIKLARIHLFENEHQQAKKLYQDVLSLNSDSVIAHQELGILFLESKQDEKALNHLNLAAELSPKDWKTSFYLGRGYFNQDNIQLAVKHLEKAKKLATDSLNSEKAEIFGLLGQSKLKLNEIDQARNYLEKSIELDPQYSSAIKSLGDVYFQSGEKDLAYEKYIEVQDSFKDDLELVNRLGELNLEKERYDAAGKYFEQSISIKEDQFEAHRNLGATLFHRQKFEESEEHLRKAIDLNSSDAQAFYYMGEIARWRGKKQRSIAYYYKTLKIEKNHSMAHYRVGKHFVDIDNARSAIYHFKKALIDDPENQRFISQLKRAQKKLKSE